MTEQQPEISIDDNHIEVTFKISLDPFLDLLSKRTQPAMKEPINDSILFAKDAAAFLKISLQQLWGDGSKWVK